MYSFNINITSNQNDFSPSIGETFSYAPIERTDAPLYTTHAFDPKDITDGVVFLNSVYNTFAVGSFGGFYALEDVVLAIFATPPDYVTNIQPFLSAVVFPAGFYYTGFFTVMQLISGSAILQSISEESKTVTVPDLTALEVASFSFEVSSSVFINPASEPQFSDIVEFSTASVVLSSFSTLLESLSSVHHKSIISVLKENGVNTAYLSGYSFQLTHLNKLTDQVRSVEETNSPYVDLSSFSFEFKSLSSGYETIGKQVEETNSPYVDLSSFSLQYYALSEGYESIGNQVEETNSPYVELSSFSLTHSVLQKNESIGQQVGEPNSPYVDLSSFSFEFKSLSSEYETFVGQVEDTNSPYVEISGFDIRYEHLSSTGLFTTPPDSGYPSMEISGIHVPESLLHANTNVRIFKDSETSSFVVQSTSTNTALYSLINESTTNTNRLTGASTNATLISHIFPVPIPYF